MGIKVLKRDGSIEKFDIDKVSKAIFNAAMEAGGDDFDRAEELAEMVEEVINSDVPEGSVSAEMIQKITEKILIEEGHAATSKEFILKAADRERVRSMDTALMKSFEEITFSSPDNSEVKRENANIDSSTAMGTMLKYGSEAAKSFNLLYLMSKDIAKAHINGDIHIHDLDFLSLTETCNQIPLDKLFKHGFNTGHGFLREPGNIRTAGALAAIAIQSNQNDQHGGQSIPMMDYYLAPYVALTFVKQIAVIAKYKLDIKHDNYEELKKLLVDYQKKHKLVMNETCEGEIKSIVSSFLADKNIKCSDKRVVRIIKDAKEATYEETYQAMEGFIHNLNTMHCLPASEKIWVLDVKTSKFDAITMEELHNTFDTNRYKVISLNKKTGKAEFKSITHCKKMGNHRNLVTITDNQGRKVRVTDNHRVMTMEGLEITEAIPKDCKSTISPMGIRLPVVKYDFCVSDYGEFGKDDKFQNDHILITTEFAKFMGYYVANGSITGDGSICSISTLGDLDFGEIETATEQAFGVRFDTNKVYNGDINGDLANKENNMSIHLGKPLASLIADKFGRSWENRVLPTELVCADKEVVTEFLKAYFKCSGIRIEDCDTVEDKQYITAITPSKKLQTSIALMIASLGVSASYKDTDDGRYCVSVDIRDADRINILSDNGLSKYKIPQILSVENNKGLIPGLMELNKLENINISNIVSKEESNSGDEYVYDISVEDNENFLTYECIYVHNSRAGRSTSDITGVDVPEIWETLCPAV